MTDYAAILELKLWTFARFMIILILAQIVFSENDQDLEIKSVSNFNTILHTVYSLKYKFDTGENNVRDKFMKLEQYIVNGIINSKLDIDKVYNAIISMKDDQINKGALYCKEEMDATIYYLDVEETRIKLTNIKDDVDELLKRLDNIEKIKKEKIKPNVNTEKLLANEEIITKFESKLNIIMNNITNVMQKFTEKHEKVEMIATRLETKLEELQKQMENYASSTKETLQQHSEWLVGLNVETKNNANKLQELNRGVDYRNSCIATLNTQNKLLENYTQVMEINTLNLESKVKKIEIDLKHQNNSIREILRQHDVRLINLNDEAKLNSTILKNKVAKLNKKLEVRNNSTEEILGRFHVWLGNLTEEIKANATMFQSKMEELNQQFKRGNSSVEERLLQHNVRLNDLMEEIKKNSTRLEELFGEENYVARMYNVWLKNLTVITKEIGAKFQRNLEELSEKVEEENRNIRQTLGQHKVWLTNLTSSMKANTTSLSAKLEELVQEAQVQNKITEKTLVQHKVWLRNLTSNATSFDKKFEELIQHILDQNKIGEETLLQNKVWLRNLTANATSRFDKKFEELIQQMEGESKIIEETLGQQKVWLKNLTENATNLSIKYEKIIQQLGQNRITQETVGHFKVWWANLTANLKENSTRFTSKLEELNQEIEGRNKLIQHNLEHFKIWFTMLNTSIKATTTSFETKLDELNEQLRRQNYSNGEALGRLNLWLTNLTSSIKVKDANLETKLVKVSQQLEAHSKIIQETAGQHNVKFKNTSTTVETDPLRLNTKLEEFYPQTMSRIQNVDISNRYNYNNTTLNLIEYKSVTEISSYVKNLYKSEYENGFSKVIAVGDSVSNLNIRLVIYKSLYSELSNNLDGYKLIKLSEIVKKNIINEKKVDHITKHTATLFLNTVLISLKTLGIDILKRFYTEYSAAYPNGRNISNDLIEEIYNFDKEFCEKLYESFINEVYEGFDQFSIVKKLTLFKCIDNNINLDLRVVGLLTYYNLVKDVLDIGTSYFVYSTLYGVKNVISMKNFNDLSEKNQYRIYHELMPNIPQCLKAIVFSKQLCIKNVGFNRYITSPLGNPSLNREGRKRHLITMPHFNQTSFIGEWRVEQSYPGFLIYNYIINEYLHTDEYSLDTNNRFIYTKVLNNVESKSVWYITPNNNNCYIRNKLMEYMYALRQPNSHFSYLSDDVKAIVTKKGGYLDKYNKDFEWQFVECPPAIST